MKAILLGLLLTTSAYSASFIGVQTDMFTGDEEDSLSGNLGYGINFSSYTENDGALKFVMGANLSYVSALGFLGATEYDMTIYGADLILGFNFSPFRRSFISPNLEIAALGGFRMFDVLSPPVGEEEKSLTTSSGYKATLAVDFGSNAKSKFRVYADYYKRSAGNVSGVSGFSLDALAIGVGYSF
jgi:hypothetical protein